MKLLDYLGLSTFINQLKQFFASKAEIADVVEDTDTYVLNVDYQKLVFDTSENLLYRTYEIVPKQDLAFETVEAYDGSVHFMYRNGNKDNKDDELLDLCLNHIFGRCGDYFTVEFDGTAYVVSAFDPFTLGTPGLTKHTFLGNLTIWQSAINSSTADFVDKYKDPVDSGEPFLLQVSNDTLNQTTQVNIMVSKNDTSPSHSIRIYQTFEQYNKENNS